MTSARAARRLFRQRVAWLAVIREWLTLRSIRARLTFWYLLTLALTMTGFATSFWLVRASMLYSQFDDALEIQGHELVAELGQELLELDPATRLAVHPIASRAPLLVRSSEGTVLYRAPGFPLIGWAADRDLAAAAKSNGTSVVPVTDRSRRDLHVVTVRFGRQGADPLTLQLAASVAPVEISLRQLAARLLMAIALVLAIAAYGSLRTAHYALAPVDKIVDRVREVQSAGLDERLDVGGGSAELDRLIATLNDMLDRIGVSVRSARRFAADASHELQTPLTVMRGLVELQLRQASEPEREQAARDLLAEIERTSVLIRDLRLFALAEVGRLVQAPEPVDIRTLVEECVEIARAIAEPKHVRVELDVKGRPVVLGSALHLRRVVLNIATNAVAYSSPGAAVRVGVEADRNEVLIVVRDEGCGIAESDLPHIFEAFYRADPARARQTGGTGLGLAIADQIVRAHGGRIAVASEPGRGSTFTVALPARLRK